MESVRGYRTEVSIHWIFVYLAYLLSVNRNIQKETSAKIETAPKDRDKHEKIKATKNSNLLSFGDDEDEDDTGDVQGINIPLINPLPLYAFTQ